MDLLKYKEKYHSLMSSKEYVQPKILRLRRKLDKLLPIKIGDEINLPKIGLCRVVNIGVVIHAFKALLIVTPLSKDEVLPKENKLLINLEQIDKYVVRTK